MSLIDQFHAGGFFMYFILVFGILTLGLIIERTTVLYLKFKSIPKNFRRDVLAFIASGDYAGAISYTEQNASGTSIGRVVIAGLRQRINARGDEALQARMDEQLTKEINHYDKRTGFLSMFGNVATLFGLLGTVTGLISSFAGVAAASPVERANLLSQGISEALNSTAFGLLAAIPALIAYAIFQNKTDRIVAEVTEQSSELYHDILFYTEADKEEVMGTIPTSNLSTETVANRN